MEDNETNLGGEGGRKRKDRRRELSACLPPPFARAFGSRVRFRAAKTEMVEGPLRRRKRSSKPSEMCFPHEYYLRRLSRRQHERERERAGALPTDVKATKELWPIIIIPGGGEGSRVSSLFLLSFGDLGIRSRSGYITVNAG